MPKLTSSAPVFLVRDVVAAANHYRDSMGFHYERFWGDPPGFVILHRDGMYLMLKQAEDPAHVIPHGPSPTRCGTPTSGSMTPMPSTPSS